MRGSSSYAVTLCLLSLSLNCYSQKSDEKEQAGAKLLGLNMEWSAGSVMLTDGTELKGKLRYNENTGILSLDAGTDSRSLSARTSVGFEFYDTRLQKQRLFYSLEFENEESIKVPMFFEALFQFRGFAVLRRMGTIKLKEELGTTDQYGNTQGGRRSETRYEQDELIYLMSERGEIKVFVRITSKDRSIDLLDSDRADIENSDFLVKLMGQRPYDDVNKYRREKKLSFKNKEELIKIFEYYQDKWAK